MSEDCLKKIPRIKKTCYFISTLQEIAQNCYLSKIVISLFL